MTVLDRLVRFPEVRAALGVSSNATLRKHLARFNIEPVELSCRMLCVRQSDLERLLSGQKEAA